MCSHLSKSIEPRNWYYSFSGSFFHSALTLHLSPSLTLSVFAHPWMRKSDYLRKKGVSTLVKGGSLVSDVSVKRLPLQLRTSPDCLTPPPLEHNYVHTHTRTHLSTISERHKVLTAKTIHTLHVPKLIVWKQCFIAALAIIAALLKISGLKGGRAAQCINTAVSHLYSQAMHFYQLLKPFPFRHSNNGAQLKETEGLHWYWTLLNGRLTSIHCHNK